MIMIIIEVIQSCPMALQLRYLQTLGSIASESKKQDEDVDEDDEYDD